MNSNDEMFIGKGILITALGILCTGYIVTTALVSFSDPYSLKMFTAATMYGITLIITAFFIIDGAKK